MSESTPAPKKKGPAKGKPQRNNNIERPKICTMDDCDKPNFAIGLCSNHYQLALKIERRITEARGLLAPLNPKNGKQSTGVGSGNRSGGGPPPKLIADESTVRRVRDLAGLQCTKLEVAAVLQVSQQALITFFEKHPQMETAYQDGRLNGKASLRRMQFVLAKRSASMGIWLGRNWLDQTDNSPGVIDGGALYGDPGSEENATALLRAVKMETE